MLRLPRLIVVICLCCGVFIDARYGRAAEFECVGEFEAAPPLLSEPDSSAILKSMSKGGAGQFRNPEIDDAATPMLFAAD